jgi:plasmid replication initiation protein
MATDKKIKSCTVRRNAKEARERQAGLNVEMAKTNGQKPITASTADTTDLPGVPKAAPAPVRVKVAAKPVPAAKKTVLKKKTPSEQTGRFTGPSSTAPMQRSNLDMPNSSTQPSQQATDATELRKLLDADPLPKGDEAAPVQDDLFTVMNGDHNWPVKDDLSSMEHPIFSLSKKPSTEIRSYSRAGNTLKVIPSGVGAPTIFDKDLMIYLVSQITKAANDGRHVSRRIHINVTHFLKGTRRSTGGESYARVVDMCRRLRGTTIETNIRTTEEERTKGFGLIENYEIKTQTKNGKGALELEVTISEWLYRAAIEYKVLTLNPGYFSLSQALERRLYELARKHCGDQPWWIIGLDHLQTKTGSEQSPRRFRQEIKTIVEANGLPDYRLGLDESVKPAQLVVMTANNAKLVFAANAKNKLGWIAQFLQTKLH